MNPAQPLQGNATAVVVCALGARGLLRLPAVWSTDGHPMMHLLSTILGAALILIVLADVFLTVLYARMGNGIVSHRLACWTWYVFRAVAKPLPRYKDRVLSFC